MRINAAASTLIVIDVQERLAPAMAEPEPIIRACATLMTAARDIGVPVLVSEQYPRGLGRTVPTLAALAPPEATIEKIHFSCLDEPAFAARFGATADGRGQAILCGIETHVCVLQTALQLHAMGREVAVVADASGSRRAVDSGLALDRLRHSGVQVVSTEMVIFEWLGRAGTNLFKAMSALIK